MKKLLILIIMILSCGIAEAAVLRGNISPSGEMTVSGGYWDLIVDETIVGSAVDFTISGLNGDTDKFYKIVVKDTATSWLSMRINSDGGANYGYQYLKGDGISLTAFRSGVETSMNITLNGGAGTIAQGELVLTAESGKVRTALSNSCGAIDNKTVGNVFLFGQSWNNTTDEITSICIRQPLEGSTIKLWRWKHD